MSIIKVRRDTAANWTASNPTLASGEPGYETDTGRIKVGDGATAYNDLPAIEVPGRTRNAYWSARNATLDPAATVWKYPSKATGLLAPLSTASIAAGTGPRALAMSADGLSVYAANNGGNSVSQYSRDPVTGQLAALTPATIACGTAPSFIVVSADGKNVYVVNTTSGTVSQYTRNTGTGVLTAMGTPTVNVGVSPRTVRVSPDGLHVYVTNFTDNTVSQFSRSQVDGSLTPLGTATAATGTGPQGMNISPDGLNVYITNFTANTVSQYTRDPTTGLLTSVAAAIACSSGPYSVAVSPDGKHVYVVTFTNSLIFTFNRSALDGSLTNMYGSQVATPGGNSPQHVTVSPDGLTVYVGGSAVNTIGIFSRNADGPLLPQTPQSYTAGTGASTRQIVVSPDGKFVYVTNSVDNAVIQAACNTDGWIDVTPAHTMYSIAGYDLYIGKNTDTFPKSRFETRRAGGLLELPFPLTPDLHVVARQANSGLLMADPTLVSAIKDPQGRYQDRLDKIASGALSRQVRHIDLVRGTANGSYATRIDGTRKHFDAGVRSSSTGLAISDTQWAAQQFDFPVKANINDVIPVQVNLANSAGYSGNVVVEIVTETTGLPGTTVIGTATVLRAALPAAGAAYDQCWVTANITLTAAISPFNRVWVRLHGTGSGATACTWRAARGNTANASIITQGVETQYYRAAVSTDSGTTFTTAAVPTNHGLYSLRIIPANLPNFLIAYICNFQSFFTILIDGMTSAAVNMWDEGNTATGGDAIAARYNYEPYLPWKLEYGMHLGAYKITEVASSNPESTVTAVVLEIPADGSW